MTMPKVVSRLKRKLVPDAVADLIDKVRPFTMCPEDRIRSLVAQAKAVTASKVDGDFVECGCCKGGTSAVLAHSMGPNRRLWIYDSFQGLPEPTERDGADAKPFVGECRGSVADVKAAMQAVSVPAASFLIHEGWFEDSFKKPLPEKVALLHCDADWYEPVLLVLRTFYDRIPVGGCVLLDDFGHWEGCREAFYDFCAERKERPVLERVGGSQAYWIKGKQHTRKVPRGQ